MANSVHVNSDKIDYIRITDSKELEFQWFDESEKKWFFGLFKRKIGAGWSKYYNDYDYYNYSRHSTESLQSNKDMLFIKDNVNGKQWFRKAYATVVMGRNYITEYFNSIEECESFVQEITAKSKSEFQVIRN